MKNEGYDGREASKDDDMEPSQWNLPGSLLYSVTIITTIGNQNQEPAGTLSASFIFAMYLVFTLWLQPTSKIPKE